jgi:hypothetical protein
MVRMRGIDSSSRIIRFVRPLAPWTPYLTAAAIYLTAGAAVVLRGRITADEGWYTYISTIVYQGRLPYRDFLFTQGPLMPYVYGAFFFFLGADIVIGRLISLVIGLVSALLLMRASSLISGKTATWIVALILPANLSYIFDTCIVKTQALTVLLSSAVLYILCLPFRTYRIYLSFLFAFLLSLTRLSMLPVLLVLIVHFLICYPEYRHHLFLAVLSVVVSCAAVLILFWSEGNMFFGMIGFHKEYYTVLPPSWEPLLLFAQTALRNQGTILLLLVSSMIVILAMKVRGADNHYRFFFFSLSSWLLITAIHATRVMPYATYQTSNIALISFAAAGPLGKILDPIHGIRYAIAIGMIATAVLVNAPFQEFIVGEEVAGTPKTVRIASDEVRMVAKSESIILTLNPELAIGSGMRLLPGYELGQFSYFHWMGDEDAFNRRVVNKTRFIDDLKQRRANVVCLTERDLAYILTGGNPRERRSLERLIRSGYRRRVTISGFGQFYDTLYVYTRRPSRN